MSVSNRAALIAKTHKGLKKHYDPTAPPSERLLLEHLLYACCLENAPHQPADDAFAKLQEQYFDWNEVRVTTVSELCDTMSSLPSPRKAATRLKNVLQSVFEAHYSFDLEPLKKENLGAACKKLEAVAGISPFCVGYVTQNALSGHAIPIDQAALDTLYALGVITESESQEGRVPGLERAIPKTKGVEFGSLLHQLAADYFGSPFSPRVRGILTEIAPDAKERFPKRSTKKEAESSSKSKKVEAADSKGKGKKKATSKSSEGQAAPKKSAKTKKVAKSKKKADPEPPKKKSSTKRLAKKKPR